MIQLDSDCTVHDNMYNPDDQDSYILSGNKINNDDIVVNVAQN